MKRRDLSGVIPPSRAVILSRGTDLSTMEFSCNSRSSLAPSGNWQPKFQKTKVQFGDTLNICINILLTIAIEVCLNT